MDMLPKCDANYTALTPNTFLKRASKVYSKRASVIYGPVRFTWEQTYQRCCRFASSLRTMGIHNNDVVSVLAPNVPALYEMHFAVPMAGAVLNAINTRLDAKNIATILHHSQAKLFFVDYEYIKVASDAINLLMGRPLMDSDNSTTPVALATPMHLQSIILIDDLAEPRGVLPGQLEYEQLVLQGDPTYIPEEVQDEWDAITLNYTSGTTSEPKGVVYSHRGAYLSTLSLILGWEMGTEPVYLWSLPMFHCNGWTFTWGVAARGGTNVCIRSTSALEMYYNIAQHHVTHMCCAPVVFSILMEAQPHERCEISKPVQVLTGGAPPPAALLQKMQTLGFHIVHAYGLTEATGPALVCEWQQMWNHLPDEEQAELKARQGISILTLADADVKNLNTMESVPRDGKTMGEIVLRGSSIMKGYLKNERANSEAFKKGWFLTGDVGVVHPDGYMEIKDRSKDVIISGGENISSVEVEGVLYKHPSVREAAVVGMPHPRWGESPCAFVVLKKGKNVIDESEIIRHCRQNLPGYMIPKRVRFMEDLPKMNNKVQKFQLRELAKKLVVSGNNNSSNNKNNNNNNNNGRQQRKKSSQLPAGYEEQVLAMSRL